LHGDVVSTQLTVQDLDDRLSSKQWLHGDMDFSVTAFGDRSANDELSKFSPSQIVFGWHPRGNVTAAIRRLHALDAKDERREKHFRVEASHHLLGGSFRVAPLGVHVLVVFRLVRDEPGESLPLRNEASSQYVGRCSRWGLLYQLPAIYNGQALNTDSSVYDFLGRQVYVRLGQMF
jgi:hypothetical protein